MTKHILTSLPILLFACLLPVQAQSGWQVTKTFSVGGQGGWDYLTVDPQTHRLYVPRSTHTMVIDSESGKTIADIPGQKIAHGVALVPEAGRGFITDGGGNGAIVIFDLKTSAILGSIVAQPDADGIIFDPGSGRVVVVSGDKGVLMSIKPDIDPKRGKIDAPLDLGGAPEFLAAEMSSAFQPTCWIALPDV
jgi:DNA-binding beta-propeller fold protein YncE